ncbi:hypothetical protein ES705_18223 [subsurface metagenome]
MTQPLFAINDLLPVRKAAEALHTSRWTIYRWIKEGKLIGVTIGGLLLVPFSDIERFDNNRRGRLTKGDSSMKLERAIER